ncbi:MAG: hypothetical protein AAB766_04475 [Patescibacteria group bacterium]
MEDNKMKERVKELKCMGFSHALAVVMVCNAPEDLDKVVEPSLEDWLQIYMTAPINSVISITSLGKARQLAKTFVEICQVYLAIVKTESSDANEAKHQLSVIIDSVKASADYNLAINLAMIYEFSLQYGLYKLRDRVKQEVVSLVLNDQRKNRELSFQLIVEFRQIKIGDTTDRGLSNDLWLLVQTLTVFDEWRAIYKKAESTEIRELSQKNLLCLAGKNQSLLIVLHRDAVLENNKPFVTLIQGELLVGNLYELYMTLKDADEELKNAIVAKLYQQATETEPQDLGAFYDQFRNIHKTEDWAVWQPIADTLFHRAKTTTEIISLLTRLKYRDMISLDYHTKLLASITTFEEACAVAEKFPYLSYPADARDQIIRKMIALATNFDRLFKSITTINTNTVSDVELLRLSFHTLTNLAGSSFEKLAKLYSDESFKSVARDEKKTLLNKMAESAKTLAEKFEVYKIRYQNTEGKATDMNKARELWVEAGKAVTAELSSLDNCLLFLSLDHESCFVGWFIENLVAKLPVGTNTFNDALRVYTATANFKSKNEYYFNQPHDRHETYKKLMQDAGNNLLRFTTNIREATQACEAGKTDPKFYAELVTKVKTFI